MNSAVRIGLIGVGGFGRFHLQSIKRIEAEGRGSLTAVADPCFRVSSNREEFEKRGVTVFSDYRELLAHREVEIVVIATPIPLHEEMARAALATDKRIYLEKPPVPTLAQLRELIALDTHRRIAVGFQMITNPALRNIKRALLDGRLGTLRAIRTGACWPRTTSYYRRAGWAGKMLMPDGNPVFDGPATNGLAHLVHNVMYLAGREMESFGAPSGVSARLARARPMEGYDAAVIEGRLEGGAEILMAFSHCGAESFPWELHVEGSKGRAAITDDGSMIKSSIALPPDIGGIEEDRFSIYRDILDWASGRSPRPTTRLQDCLPYSSTTCAALASSGGIHDIASAIEIGSDEDRLYDVPELTAWIRTAVRGTPAAGRPPSLHPGHEVRPAALDRFDFREFAGRRGKSNSSPRGFSGVPATR